MGMEADDPRRFRRQGPAAPRSLNAPRAAEGIMSSFGPGKPGCFGEGGNGASVSGPLALTAGQVFESEEEFNLRMLSHKTHAENGEEAQTGAEVETEADTGLEAAASNRRTVDVVPSTHTDTADFCLRADQDRLRDQPPPELAPRDTFEDNYLTDEQLAAQEAEVDHLLMQFKAKGNVRKSRQPVADMNGSKLDRRRAEEIPAEELLQNYKVSAESDESRRRRLAALPAPDKAAKDKEQAESLAFYRKQRGLE